MKFKPLNGLNIAITRPAGQAKNLSQKIKALGGRPVLFPTIEIASPDNLSTAINKLKRLSEYDVVIFISPNAVSYAAALFKKHRKLWPQNVQVAAVGESTAAALLKRHYPVHIVPREYSSEGLLKSAKLKKVKGQRVLLIRGQGGRNLLAATLRSRGAVVMEAIVYKRVKPKIAIEFFPRNEKIDMIVCTSNESVRNLCAMAGKKQRLWLIDRQLLVSSERIKQFAKELGFVKKPILADNATDAAILEGCLQFAKMKNEKLYGNNSKQ